jgi:hypothetical protein
MKKHKIKQHVSILIILAASILLVLFNFFMFDIINAFDKPGCKCIDGIAWLCVYISICDRGPDVLIYVIVRIKQIKLFALIHCVIIAVTVLFFIYIPYTDTYQKIYFALEKNHLNETIQMIGTDELWQTGMDEFRVPYRLTSHTGKFYVSIDNDVTRAEFTIYKGLDKSSILIYTSGTDKVNENDFSLAYIKRVSMTLNKWTHIGIRQSLIINGPLKTTRRDVSIPPYVFLWIVIRPALIPP